MEQHGEKDAPVDLTEFRPVSTTHISPACLLTYDDEATRLYPAKIDPEHQRVVFSNDISELVLTRSNVEAASANTDSQNVAIFGIRSEEFLKGWLATDYSVLRPAEEAAEIGIRLHGYSAENTETTVTHDEFGRVP